jgi:hypothetical protein
MAKSLEEQAIYFLEQLFDVFDGQADGIISEKYEEAYQEILRQLTVFLGSTEAQQAANTGFFPLIPILVSNAMSNVSVGLSGALTTFLEGHAGEAEEFARAVMSEFSGEDFTTENIGLGIGVALSEVLNDSYDGVSYQERFERATTSIGDQLLNTITTGIATGVGLTVIARGLRETFEKAKYYAERIYQTEAVRVLNTTILNVYEAFGASKVKWVLGNEMHKMAPCPTCREKAHGGENGDGVYRVGYVPALPVHPKCRCTIVPIN